MRKKRSSWKCLTSVLALSLGITLSALPGCKTVDSFGVQKFRSVDTVVVRDSVLVRDSIVYCERTIHDTVYITKELYRDRLEARGERQKAVKTDTIVRTDSIVQVIEQPPERYIPKFYKHCTIYFWCAIVLLLLYIVFRITKAKLRMPLNPKQ